METERTIDEEHLRLLAIFHYVIGGMHLLFGSIFGAVVVLHVLAIACFTVLHSASDSGAAPLSHGASASASLPHFSPLVWPFIAVAFGIVLLVGVGAGVLTIYSGRCLAKRRRRTFSTVIAAIVCFWIPFGTILGVLTLVVLSRTSVRRLYEAGAAAIPASAPTP